MYATLRPSPPPPGESFRLLSLRSPAFGAHWHYHDSFELNLILAGAGTRWVAGSSARFGPGDIVLVPPGVPHSWVSDPPQGRRMAAAVVILFSADLLGGTAALPELASACALVDEAGTGYRFIDGDGRIARRLRGLPRLEGASRLLDFFACLDLLARAPRESVRDMAAGPQPGERERAMLRRAFELIDAAERDPPPQADVAAALALSPPTFSRMFRRGTGQSYSAFVQARRLDRACAMLQRDDAGIAHIAFAAGFGNLSNFNRRFLSALGETPRSYRRRFRAEMERPPA
jgi:AraC-like DNA-binding protein